MLKFIFYDVKKAVWKWSILGLFPLIYLVAIIMTFDMPLSTAVSNLLSALMPLMLMVVYADHFSADYLNKTYKTLYTGIFSREALMIAKVGSCTIIAYIFGFVHWAMPIPANLCEGKVFIDSIMLTKLPETLLAYTISGICLSSFCLMMAVFSKKFTITFVVCFILFYDLISQAVGMVANSDLGTLSIVAALLPFRITPLVLTTLQISAMQIIILLTSSFVFSMIGLTKLSFQECH